MSGNTKPYKEEIKTLGFKWSNNKQNWYKAPEGYYKYSGKQYEMNQIREMYGSKTINNEGREDENKPKRAALAQ